MPRSFQAEEGYRGSKSVTGVSEMFAISMNGSAGAVVRGKVESGGLTSVMASGPSRGEALAAPGVARSRGIPLESPDEVTNSPALESGRGGRR